MWAFEVLDRYSVCKLPVSPLVRVRDVYNERGRHTFVVRHMGLRVIDAHARRITRQWEEYASQFERSCHFPRFFRDSAKNVACEFHLRSAWQEGPTRRFSVVFLVHRASQRRCLAWAEDPAGTDTVTAWPLEGDFNCAMISGEYPA